MDKAHALVAAASLRALAPENAALLAAYIRNLLTAVCLTVDVLETLATGEAQSQYEADAQANLREDSARPAKEACEALKALAECLEPIREDETDGRRSIDAMVGRDNGGR